MLKPIGSEYAQVLPPFNEGMMNAEDFKSASAVTGRDGSHFRVITWRVTGHNTKAGREIVESTGETKYYHPVRWELFRGRVQPVPPDELLPLMSDDWRHPVPYITYAAAS